MAKQWKCERCGTRNPESTLTCATCRSIRGAVVVKPPAGAPDPWQTPDPWQVPAQPAQPVPPPSGTYWTQPALGAQPAASSHSRSRLIVPVVLLVGGILGLAVFLASPEATPVDTLTGSAPEVATSYQLQVGDCVDIADASGEVVEGIDERPCNFEHEYEVFFSGAAEGSAYLSDAAFDDYYRANCLPAFEAYIGETYEDSALDIFWLVPTEEAWADGDRTIQCLVYHPRIPRLTTSLKGSGRLRA